MSRADPSVLEAKRSLRARIREVLARVSTQEAGIASAVACGRLLHSTLMEGVRTIMLYAPLAGELDPAVLARECMVRGLRLALPRTDWNSKRLIPALIPAWGARLVLGRHSILEPAPDLPQITLSELDAVVVPGLVFDERGGRLGRGAGFYDRFLAEPELRARRWGLAFEVQVAPDAGVPLESHDVRMDALVTDTRVLEFPSGR